MKKDLNVDCNTKKEEQQKKSDVTAVGDSQLAAIVQPLLSWYDTHARVLPWREHPAPYRVWVSEIMLQQTRVEAVKPYFERFMTALPTIRDLAEAPEDVILKLWEGLGYYNRVRNMQKAARKLVAEYDGQMPADFDAILALPGIGSYTAGAIASIAFGINSSAYVAEIIRAGILAVDKGQTEAARSLGLSSWQSMRLVVLPQAIKNVLPALANEVVTMVKESSICSVLGMAEIMYTAQAVAGNSYITLSPYVLAAIIYFCINYPASKAIEAIERRMRRGDKQ